MGVCGCLQQSGKVSHKGPLTAFPHLHTQQLEGPFLTLQEPSLRVPSSATMKEAWLRPSSSPLLLGLGNLVLGDRGGEATPEEEEEETRDSV